MKNLPNKITFSRLLFGLLMLLSVYKKNMIFFVIFYVFALITDILDGFVARKLNKKTEFGKKFDILADNFILFCVLVGIYFFKKQTLLKFSIYFIEIFTYYLIIQIISFLKTKKLIFMRTYTANLTAILFPFAVFFIMFFESKTAVLTYGVLMIYSLTEKLILHLANKKNTIFLASFIQIILFLIIFISVSSLFFIYNPGTEVCFNERCIDAEVMDTPEERALGLMYRPKINETEGMLFIFPEPKVVSFWMKNVQFSIDMVFIDENKSIVRIEKGVPPCYKEPCLTYSSIKEVKYVVEVISGFSDKYNLTENTIIEIN